MRISDWSSDVCSSDLLDDVQGPAPDLVQRSSDVRSAIPSVSEEMPQPGERMTDGGEQGGRAIPVLNIGAMNGEADEQAGGVGDNVAFASLDLLSGIIARNTAAFRGFDALAVDDAGRRTGL